MSLTLADAIDVAHRGGKIMIQCPVHGDETPSLSVGPGSDQPVTLHCHAGCETEDILRAEGLDWSAVSNPKDTTTAAESVWTPAGDASHVYTYVDEDGQPLFEVLRVPQPNGKKTFRQRHWDAEEQKWAWNLQGVRRVIYRLPEIIRAIADGEEVLIVEGEKDVETARLAGHVATTVPMGAGKWLDEFSPLFAHGAVALVADADDAGRKHMRQVADSLIAQDCQVRVLETALHGCNDLTDHFSHGGTLDSMVEVFRWPEQKDIKQYGLGIQDFLNSDFSQDVEVIEGHMAQANVCVFTGMEGSGKSMFLRQMAATLAGGLHPFYVTPHPKRRVLYIDAENPEHQQMFDWRILAGLVARHTGEPIPNENLTILSEWRNEPDLLTGAGEQWLYERVNAFQPEVMFIGPVSNVVGRDTREDEVVRKLKRVINNARSICNTAIILEHHAPHRAQGDTKRSIRPYGSSQFLRWPDYGYGLAPTEDPSVFEIQPFRGPRVRRRAWPTHARHGKPNTAEMPWEMQLEGENEIIHGRFG